MSEQEVNWNRVPILLENIEKSEDKASAILDLKLFLSTARSHSLNYNNYKEKILPLLPDKETFHTLFKLLAVRGEVCENTCVILSTFLNLMKPDVAFHTYQNELLSGLKHPSTDVRLLCCEQVRRIIEDKEHLSLVTNEPEFIISIIDCMCEDSDKGHLVKRATDTLLALGKCEIGMQMLFGESSSVLGYLKDRLETCNSIIWFRTMEIALKCCVHSKDAMKLCESNGLLEDFLAKLSDTDDLLSQICALKELTVFTTCEHGYEWLKHESLLEEFEAMLEDDDSPFAELIRPELMKFFAGLSKTFPGEMETNHRRYLEKLCNIITADDTTVELRVNAIDSLTVLLSHDQGKMGISNLGEAFTAVVRYIGQTAKSGAASSLRDQCLWCIGELLNVAMPYNRKKLVPLCESWYHELDTQPLEFLLKLSKSPIVESRIAVQKIYTNIADQTWALKEMRDHPTFCEYLLDHSTESEDEGYFLKYLTVQTILSTKACEKIFPPSYILKLKMFRHQGTPYVRQPPQVATMEG